MPITPEDLATAIAQVAYRPERHGADRSRVRASRAAARAIGEMRVDHSAMRCRAVTADSTPVSIETARSMHDFDNLVHGIGQAQRGWLKKADLLSTGALDSRPRRLKHKEAR
jgi:hypothetical protein